MTVQRTDPEQAAREQQLTETVLASFANTPEPRLRYLMEKLVEHAHAYVREVRLTEAEWERCIGFLTDAGHITDGHRQEFILLSDVLGVSMQTIAVNNAAHKDATEATVFGPFFVEGAPEVADGGDIAGDASGEPCHVTGTVHDTEGNEVPGARLEVWQSDDEGLYDVQRTDAAGLYGRGFLHSDEHGGFRLWALTPTPYPIPDDGPVGKLLTATGRSPYRAAHLHFMVTAPGYRTLVTHVFVEDDPQLAIGDSVFGVKQSLIKPFTRHSADTATPDGRDLAGRSWTSVHFDIVLAPAIAPLNKAM